MHESLSILISIPIQIYLGAVVFNYPHTCENFWNNFNDLRLNIYNPDLVPLNVCTLCTLGIQRSRFKMIFTKKKHFITEKLLNANINAFATCTTCRPPFCLVKFRNPILPFYWICYVNRWNEDFCVYVLTRNSI